MRRRTREQVLSEWNSQDRGNFDPPTATQAERRLWLEAGKPAYTQQKQQETSSMQSPPMPDAAHAAWWADFWQKADARITEHINELMDEVNRALDEEVKSHNDVVDHVEKVITKQNDFSAPLRASMARSQNCVAGLSSSPPILNSSVAFEPGRSRPCAERAMRPNQYSDGERGHMTWPEIADELEHLAALARLVVEAERLAPSQAETAREMRELLYEMRQLREALQ